MTDSQTALLTAGAARREFDAGHKQVAMHFLLDACIWYGRALVADKSKEDKEDREKAGDMIIQLRTELELI